MEAWQSHWPRFALWQDALERDLIELEDEEGSARPGTVRLTAAGRASFSS